MKTQQERDDAELEILKQKLLNTKNLPMPSDKDEVIEYLQVRLESAEEAIATCEEIIEHERSNRNQMSQDLKERNATLKTLIEKERNNISEKVNQELETTLAMALREKEQTQELYTATLNELREKTQEIEDLERENEILQEKCEDQEKTINTLNEQIDQATGEADQLENIRGNLEGENSQLKEETEKAVSSRAQAAEAIIKLDEARNLLNKLLGN